MNTGMQFTIAHAGLEDLLRVPLRRGLGADREVVDDDVRTGLLEDLRPRRPSRPGAFSTTCAMYLPMPSWVMPRETFTPVFGTSENLIVSLG